MDRDRLVRLVVLGMLLPTLLYYVATASHKPELHFGAYGYGPNPSVGIAIQKYTVCSFNVDFSAFRSGKLPKLVRADLSRSLQAKRTQVVSSDTENAKKLTPKSSSKLIKNNKGCLRDLDREEQLRAIFCKVVDVACTNWKRLLMIMSGRTNRTDPLTIPSHVPHIEGVLKRLSDKHITSTGLRRIFKTYTKFIFVRHPLERLTSAYRNKLVKNTSSANEFKKRYGVSMLKKYRKSKHVSEKGNGVKFSEFVNYLVDYKGYNNRAPLNEHWAPYVDMCHPCAINYDIIGKYETLEEDAEYLLRKVGANEDLHFPPVNPSNTATFVPFYMSTLSKNLTHRLLDMYSLDFKIFDYEEDSPQQNGS
ncbi:unnamed protein product, partial [Meganyctiphanes norvegica]